jgi:ComF family protein
MIKEIMFKFINFFNKVTNFIKYGLNYILSAPFCFYCKENLDKYLALCTNCSDLIKAIPSEKITINNFNITVFAVSAYKEPLKSLILAKKYSDRSAALKLAEIIFKNNIIQNLEFDYLVPVPLHFTRKYARGYNQAEIIAQELAFLSKKKMLKCIKRTKKTQFQSILSYQQREQNVKDVFEILNLNVNLENKILVLVDDLMTTGSTIKNCAKALLKFKPQKIYAIVACRVSS